MDEEFEREDELRQRQGGSYPVGCALRSTFPADNHDSLQPDLTALMIALSHQPYERQQAVVAPPTASGLIARIAQRWRG